MIKEFFKKLDNWLTFGKFSTVFIVTYEYNNKRKSVVIGAEHYAEAIEKTYKLYKNKCEKIKIIEIIEY